MPSAESSTKVSAGTEPEFVVEKITGKRYVNGRVEMQVKWKGISPEKSSWEPIRNLAKCIDLISDFESELYRRQEIVANKPRRTGTKRKASSAANQPKPAEAKKAKGPMERKVEVGEPMVTNSKVKESSTEPVPQSRKKTN